MSAHENNDRTGEGHETTDATVRPLLQFAVSLAVLTLLIAFFIVGLYRYLDAREIREKAGQFPLAAGQGPVVPPPPRLQTYPFDDVKALHREERRYLDDYAWIDKNAGVVRIPVERAIDILAERGLPHRSATGDGAPATSQAGH
jgi:hypothetical protein